ncbi:MAG: SH3 domain-containing protein [Polyangiaceae bacterium]
MGGEVTFRFVCAARMVLGLGAAVAGLAASRDARAQAADEEPEAFARVVVDAAELRSGPGVSYRTIYSAHRGETFALDGRNGSGFWLRVLLPDGRSAYALGDEVQTFAVSSG